jgi:diamine N-acetyltransferase
MAKREGVVNSGSIVTLREITGETARTIMRLEVSPEQRKFVAPNSVSIAEAYFEDKAWFRAIYADETPVGFIMLYDDPGKPTYYLWRLMIGEQYQGNGFGSSAVKLLVKHVRTRPNATELLVSHVEGPGSPEGFYRKLDFEHTGEVDHGERVMRLVL